MDWPVIIGISSSIIALCALVFTIWQGFQVRKHNKLSYRPHLTTWTTRNADNGFYSVELMNNGLGPALIENFVLKVDGEIIPGVGTEPVEKALKILLPNHNYNSEQSFVSKGYSMPAKDKCTIVAVQFTNPPFPTREFVEHTLNRGDIEISYKSFYNEFFKLSTEDEKPKNRC
ncbi:MAG: hypothetical protein ABSE89_00185 [Sedimentisphaerales bacterium]